MKTDHIKYIAGLVVVGIAAWLLVYSIVVEQERAEEERAIYMDKLTEQMDKLEILEAQIDDLGEQITNFLDKWAIIEAEITAYAPLDPSAKEGICYSGDPFVTASGAQVVPGVTVAAGPSVPFGTRVWVKGYGWRVVQDRGGRIGEGCLDIAVASRAEALALGRRKVVAVWEKN